MKIDAVSHLKGTLCIPGDKSISHRSVMLGSLAKGSTHITGFLPSADCLATMDCMEKMGVTIDRLSENEMIVHGVGLHGLMKPLDTLNTCNSGTTTRLLSGILAGQDFNCRIEGDESLSSRPMGRIMTPLRMMGASIQSEKDNNCAPLLIKGSPLTAIHYNSPVASAQVKSCVLLAGLYAKGNTSVTEPALSRDHTERMLPMFGGNISVNGLTSTVTPVDELFGTDVSVPGDISSAAFFLCAAAMHPDAEVRLEHVGINPTRDGVLRVLKAMGADFTLENENKGLGEPCADIIIRSSKLHGTVIEGDIIPTLIDEIPMIAVMAAFAEGETIIRDAAELKVKETDRLALITENLKNMGCDITATEDGMIIRGGKNLHGTTIKTLKDHRMAMAFAIAGLITGDQNIMDASCVDVSYPTFFEELKSLCQ
ncbi:MAG: 3-phosphoshikimate 1-carboxyvinyltransferase [Lachnospiraceae bacterium]|nr:3-phosphoshikimate 1-carboxyvinyltransferase [Candidatus Equihabitans merdae]